MSSRYDPPVGTSPGNHVIVRTSDRILFKRCRRLWGWMSPMRLGIELQEQADYFWFGTGMHFALEDYHGRNVYGHPGKAFLAYSEATCRAHSAPATWKELTPVGVGMMCYYADFWLRGRDPLQTYYVDGEPQQEINAHIDLQLEDSEGRKVFYGFTIDRVVIDEHDRLWIVEYKSAKQFRVFHFDTDDQITAYCWAAQCYYGVPVAGVIYQQHKKQVPALPKVLTTGKISTDTKMATTASLYRRAILDMYGSLDKAPTANIQFLNNLVAEETEHEDRFVVRHIVERNQHQLQKFQERVYMELEDMLNPDLPLYPNQTKDCSWSCPLQAACIALEDGSDYEQLLGAYVRQTPTQAYMETKWRNHLPLPEEISLPEEQQLFSSLLKDPLALPSLQTPEMRFLEEMF